MYFTNAKESELHTQEQPAGGVKTPDLWRSVPASAKLTEQPHHFPPCLSQQNVDYNPQGREKSLCSIVTKKASLRDRGPYAHGWESHNKSRLKALHQMPTKWKSYIDAEQHIFIQNMCINFFICMYKTKKKKKVTNAVPCFALSLLQTCVTSLMRCSWKIHKTNL